MSNYTAEEVEAALIQLQDEEDRAEVNWKDYSYCLEREIVLSILDNVERARVEFIPEPEQDCTGPIYILFFIGTQIFRKSGRYYSHYGVEWDYLPFTEVKPRQIMTTVYEEM